MIVKDGEGVSRLLRLKSMARPRREMRVAPQRPSPIRHWSNAPGPEAIRIGVASCVRSAIPERRMIEEKTDIWYGDLPIVRARHCRATPWAKLKAVAASKEFCVKIDLSLGEFSHTVWTTDLTEEYVRLNLGE